MNLEFNHPYKYKDLCEVLGLERKSGSAQRTQLSHLKQEYKIEKINKHYIIYEKYDNLKKIEQMTYHKHKAYIEPMLYMMLASSPNNVIKVDMKQLMTSLAVVNDNFFYAKWNLEKTDMLLTGKSNGGLNLFIQDSEPMLRRIIKSVLKEMESECLIHINEIPTFAKKYKGTDNKWYTVTYEINKEEEYPVFLEAKRQMLKKYNVKKITELDFFQQSEAKHYIENILKEKLGVEYFYYSYEIILNKVGIQDVIVSQFDNYRKEFNKYVQNKVLTSKRKHIKMLSDSDKKIYVDTLIDMATTVNVNSEENVSC